LDQSVIIYSTNDCIECEYVKRFMIEEEVAFEVRDISVSNDYKREVEKYGFLGVPVIVIGETAVKGFTPEMIELVQNAKK
jgi:glutaredoxin-like protein NrdH